MLKPSIVRWVTVAFVAGLGLQMGVAAAQDAQHRNNAEIQSTRTANLSGPEQLREAGHHIDALTSVRRRVSDMLDRARQERDIIKVNCLNDKLTQVDVTLRSAREHQELLQTAVGINNDGQRVHEYTLLTIFRQRGESLEAEARQCIGEEAGGFGEGMTVTVQVNPDIPTQPTDEYPVETVVPEIPPSVSPIH